MFSNFKDFQEVINSQQETSKSTIDLALSEFKTWKTQIRTQLDDTESLFRNELESFNQKGKSQLNEIGQKLVQDMDDYETKVQKQHDALNNQITELQEKTQNSIADYEKSASQIQNNIKKMYDDMLEQTEQKIEQQNLKAKQNLEDFQKQMQNVQAENQANETKFIMKMQDDSNMIQTHVIKIQKEFWKCFKKDCYS